MYKRTILFLLLTVVSFRGYSQGADTNIVIVNIGHLDRIDLARQIEIIKKSEPKVIALEVFLSKDSLEKDSGLVRAIRSTPNLVLACSFEPDGYGYSLKKSNPKFIPRTVAHINLFSSVYRKEYAITAFPPFIQYGNETYTALSLVLAKTLDPGKTAFFLNKYEKKTLIPIRYRYPSVRFTSLSEAQVLNESFDPNLLKGKIVLLGYNGPKDEDLYSIPVSTKQKKPVKQYGVQIQAYIIYMILSH